MSAMRELFQLRHRSDHPYAWLWEPLERDAGFVLRAMFGTKALYYEGRLTLCFSAQEEPWQGVLVCTEQAHHASLRASYPSLRPHPILAKWLYLPEAAEDFERAAMRLVADVRARDPRIGVAPRPRRRRQAPSAPRQGDRAHP